MSQHQYHYLIAGLPDLSIENQKAWISIPDFREMLREELHEDDFPQVELVFLKEDNINLLEFMETGEVKDPSPGNYTEEDFREQSELLSAILPEDDAFPAYMRDVLKLFRAEEKEFDRVKFSHLLADQYYDHLMEKGSHFLREFSHFEYDLENLRAFMEAEKYKLDKGRFIAGSSQHADHLRASIKGALGKDPEFEFFDEIVDNFTSDSMVEKEMNMDKLKWQVIDDMIFFEEFTIDWVLGYLKKMMIIERWSKLKHEEGEKKLRNIIKETEQYAAMNINLED